MSTEEIAKRLVALCSAGDFEKAQNELFAEDAVSIEPHATPAFQKETKGLQAIREKAEKWNGMVQQTNSITVSDPLVADNSFACTIGMDVVMKEMGPLKMTELCVYHVKDGKIVSEQFFM